jgi:hypothetical protein
MLLVEIVVIIQSIYYILCSLIIIHNYQSVLENEISTSNKNHTYLRFLYGCVRVAMWVYSSRDIAKIAGITYYIECLYYMDIHIENMTWNYKLKSLYSFFIGSLLLICDLCKIE